LIHDSSLRCANTLLILNEFVSKPAKEFNAAHCSVVGMDHLLEKWVGINSNNAKDAEVDPLVPILGGKIAVHLQLVHTNPDVQVNGAGTLVMCPANSL
jgi:hypothetical protein